MELPKFIQENPSYVRPTFEVLIFCEQEQEFSNIVQMLRQGTYAKTFVAQPDAFVAMLRDWGLLSMTTYVDGCPYGGTAQELADDPAVSADAQITYGFQATQQGGEVADALAPANRLTTLFEADAEENKVYQRILQLADVPQGASRNQLEAALYDDGLIPRDPRTGLVSVFPSYYIDNLERAGGLVWESSWKTTEAGRGFKLQ
ncbi:hypothetical protein [Parvibacter caecicola]|uniref:hypothetical protein n=1 Tax=Parvibacter caecicola TaxID=747645 RepID=UPI0023F16FC9|nr:hypothetical protein [Parvibacter caecicola]